MCVGCIRSVTTLFYSVSRLLFAFFFNGTFSNVKMNVKIPLGLGHSDRLSDLQTGSKSQKLAGEFSWKCVYDLLEEKCYHTVF